MIIYAIRHLITPWNRQGLLQGNSDIALLQNDGENVRIASQLRKELASVAFQQVVVSPMKRAVQTAELLGYNDFTIDERVTEMSFMQFEGKPKADMLAEMNGQWQADPLNTALGPELKRLEARIEAFLAHYNDLDKVLLISHGAYVRALNAFINHASLDTMNQIEFGNGEQMILEWKNP